MAKSNDSRKEICETQAHAVAKDLASEFVQKTMGMEKEEIWEAAGHLVAHFAAIENSIDGAADEEEDLLIKPAYGNPVWEENHVEEEEEAAERSNGSASE